MIMNIDPQTVLDQIIERTKYVDDFTDILASLSISTLFKSYRHNEQVLKCGATSVGLKLNEGKTKIAYLNMHHSELDAEFKKRYTTSEELLGFGFEIVDIPSAPSIENNTYSMTQRSKEITLKFSKISGVNIYNVIDAIKKRETHKNIMRPGLRVASACENMPLKDDDIVVVVQGDTGHPTGLLPSMAFQHGEDLTGDAGVLLGTNEDRVHVTTYDELWCIDLNGDEPDLGFYINITENNEFKNFGVDVWIDPDPNLTSYSNLPEGQHDLISIITHEIAHAMGLAGTLDPYWSVNHYSKSLTEKDGQYYYSSERITNLIGKDLLTAPAALDHHVEDPQGGISGIASIMSGQMYSQRWSEPGPIELSLIHI